MPVSQSISVPYTSNVTKVTFLGMGISAGIMPRNAPRAARPVSVRVSRRMDLLEYQGKQLLARHGLKVSSGAAVQSVADAVKAANEVGYPVVVKAQVLIGGRGKAGGVKLAANEAEVAEHAERILGMDIRGHVVRTLWIEHASEIAREYYAAVLLDRSAKRPLVIFSVEGGVEIEEVAERSPENLVRRHVVPRARLSREQALDIAFAVGSDEDVRDGFA